MSSTQHASSDDTQGLERPATALLSYAWEDAEEVKFLHLQLKVRGVRAWRDVTDLPLGGATEDEIVHAIATEADALVIYVTPHSLQSRFVWGTEIKAALERRERDPLFNIVPILKGVTLEQLQQQCAAYGYRSLKDFNAVGLLDSSTNETGDAYKEQLRAIANRVLKATLALRLRRAKADRAYEPSIVLRTFKDIPPTPSLDLDLDWWDVFQDRNRLPPSEEWRDLLFPALQDVKNALVEQPVSRKLHMSLNAILPTAFALGYAFPAPARYILLLESKDGTWSTAGTGDAAPPFRRIPYNENGDPQVAVIEISITGPTAHATTQYLNKSQLSYGHHILYELPGGPDHISGVKDAAHALAMSQYIGRELRLLSGQGVTHIHLFAAIPAALAVMLGHQFNALCPISLYQYAANKEYELACTLGSYVG
jgi:SMODS-associated and fused to various effectors sensor domain/TIR domain